MTIKRIRFLQELLAFAGLGRRLHLEWISSAEAQKFVSVVSAFTESIRRLGPSPLKGFTRSQTILRPRAVPAPGGKTASETARPADPTAAGIT